MFADRSDAGRRLAQVLLRFKDQHPVILALPRGGVPVAFEVAKALDAPLDVLLIRKIGVPGQPELALGAVVDGDHPHLVINRHIAAMIAATEAYIAEQEAAKLREIEQRRALYLTDRPRVNPSDRTAIVVDDGIATGATMRAALQALRDRKVRRLVVAVPVAPRETADEMREIVDDWVCLDTPDPFSAVGAFYRDFRQTTDAEVIDLLDRARDASQQRVSTPTGIL